MKANKKEITIGLCVLIALLVLFGGINYLKGINVFKTSNYYYSEYTNVAGLQVSAPVTLNGFKVGQVRDITYQYDNPGHVLVEISVDRALRLPKGSKALIEQDILGTATIVLKMSDSKDFHDVGNMLIGETASGMLESVSNDLMPKVSAVFPKIDSLLTSLNTLVADPALAASVHRLDDITRSLDATLRQVNLATSKLPGIVRNVDTITVNFGTVSSNLADFSGQLKQMPIDSTMQNIEALSANLRLLSASLNNPDSSLGLLTRDRALYDNLNQCAASLDSLLIDVKKNPKRYISIKLL